MRAYFCSVKCQQKFDNTKMAGYALPTLLVALKNHHRQTLVTSEEGLEAAEKYNVPFFEVDALTGKSEVLEGVKRLGKNVHNSVYAAARCCDPFMKMAANRKEELLETLGCSKSEGSKPNCSVQ